MYETIAVVGATGAVGRIVLEQIQQRQLPYRRLRLLASKRTAGQIVEFKGQSITVEELTPDVFAGIDLAIASTPDEVAREFVPWALKHGTVVVDESGFFRMEPHVPLVVPEVNPDAIDNHQGIISSPNCSTTQLVVALAPLHREARVRRVIVSTYQATSGAGLAGQQELLDSTKDHLSGKRKSPAVFQYPIAFNLIPQIGSPKYEGYTSEEMKMVYETRKILEDPSIQVCATCVRVPVMVGHSETIVVETDHPITPERARELFEQAPGITVIDDLSNHLYPMPAQVAGRDDVVIGRIRRDLSCKNGLAFWCVSDNLRKGAATNAVQIAELLLKKAAAIGTS